MMYQSFSNQQNISMEQNNFMFFSYKVLSYFWLPDKKKV